MVTDLNPTQIMRVTTQQTLEVASTPAVGANLYFDYDSVGYRPQILRYHIMSFTPGKAADPGTMNKNFVKAILWDLRLKDKTMEWPLDTAGDGTVNATAFEECDYNGKNGAAAIKNPKPLATNGYTYPANSKPSN